MHNDEAGKACFGPRQQQTTIQRRTTEPQVRDFQSLPNIPGTEAATTARMHASTKQWVTSIVWSAKVVSPQREELMIANRMSDSSDVM